MGALAGGQTGSFGGSYFEIIENWTPLNTQPLHHNICIQYIYIYTYTIYERQSKRYHTTR
jgi:hypothetical protein